MARTIEELILADDRAVCMAPLFLKKFSARLDEIPEAGEAIALSELGTHCRGALFLDGTYLLTPALHDAVERVIRGFGGFYFGRYDVRAECPEAFRRGEFKVIELNGLTSEATSIYDPQHSVWFGLADALPPMADRFCDRGGKSRTRRAAADTRCDVAPHIQIGDGIMRTTATLAATERYDLTFAEHIDDIMLASGCATKCSTSSCMKGCRAPSKPGSTRMSLTKCATT